MNNTIYDFIIVGGGALGTFHAYHALQKGLRVLLIEKNSKPQGATVRNFGQVVPSGMNQKWQAYGRESLRIYNHIQQQFDITVKNNGSVYIASNQEELQLIEELHEINKINNYTSQLLTKQQCLTNYKGLKQKYCKAALFFPDEITVEPRTMIHRLHSFMIANLQLHYQPNTTVINIDEINHCVQVTTANNKTFAALKVIVCTGSDFKSLYPEIYNHSDLVVSKLQMLQTIPQKNYKLPGSILTGLTIRRYEAFTECASYQSIKKNEAKNSLEKQYGVHILFKQASDGSVIIGDSHQYAEAKNSDVLGFDLNMAIDDFMIKEAKKIIDLPSYTIQNRWAGFYSQCKFNDIFKHAVSKNIHIVTGIGGKGMTASAGYAKENINNLI